MISTNENAGGITLRHIESLTAEFAAKHDLICGIVQKIQDEVTAIHRKYHMQLKSAVNQASAQKVALHTAIQSAPDLFEKPRTHIFHGVKVGYQKGKGTLEWEDPDKVVAALRKMFGEDAIAYIRTTEVPDKKMLADMPVSELRKLSITVTDTGDQIVIKPTDSEIEKTVAVLLKDAIEA